ncbi:hypothetical protein SASPL_133132 [Salvia splendens]|uniref:Transposase n=1 Tax=Salvia splendens TaxID=180675 RepID=A0A8X8ZHS6_SALSN|nr:uncharacterized protein LOC121757507 [Salvia splendens]KAG6405542.1 hypothetical protein SASPL_133132 [Salvia splendens]
MIHPSMSREITTTFKRIRNITGFTWMLTPKEIKDAYYQELEKAYSWPDSWEHDVHKLWKNGTAKRFSGFISAIKKTKTVNVGKPSYVPEEMWNGLVEHWNKPTVKAKSEASRRAKFSESNGPGTGYVRHHGRSVSVAVIAQKIAKERSIPIDKCMHEAFMILHHKNGEYTYKKAANLDEKVRRIADEQGDGANLNKIFMQEVMKDIDKKKSMLGTGVLGPTLLDNFATKTTGSTSSQVDAEWKIELEAEREKRMKLKEDFKSMQQMVEELGSQC